MEEVESINTETYNYILIEARRMLEEKEENYYDIKLTSLLKVLIENPNIVNSSDLSKSLYKKVEKYVLSLIKQKANTKEHLIDSDDIDELKSYVLNIYDSLSKNEQFISEYRKCCEIFQLRFNSWSARQIEAYKSDFQKIDFLENSVEKIVENNSKFSTQISNIESEIECLKNIDYNAIHVNANKLLNEIENLRDNARQTVGNIAENRNAGKYKEYYENCRKSAFWLFWASLAIMISTAITVTYNCVTYGMLDQSDFSGLLSRISLTALVLLPSFFMMREAKKLKDKEFQYYDMMCRIVTSAPYIDGLTHLDDNQKDQMKADLVKDFFARPIECRDDGGLVPIEEICKIAKACTGEKE